MKKFDVEITETLQRKVSVEAASQEYAERMVTQAWNNQDYVLGSGKGSPEYWVAVVKPGRVLFELADVDEATAREALRLAMHKLPIKCKFVVREDSVKEDGTNEG